MDIEELKKIVRGNGFQESHGSTTMVIDVETVIDLLDELKQCDIPVVGVTEGELCDNPHCEDGIADRDMYGHPIYCQVCDKHN